jgi:hypothetical protein
LFGEDHGSAADTDGGVGVSTDKMQPLDVGIFGPMKHHLSYTCIRGTNSFTWPSKPDIIVTLGEDKPKYPWAFDFFFKL